MHLILLWPLHWRLPCANIDADLAGWFRQHLSPLLADVLLALTAPGSALCIGAIILLAILWLAWTRRWLAMTFLLLTVGGGTLLGESLKLLFHRQRPFAAGPFGLWGGYSFPSGHTIAATLLYGSLALALLPLFKRRRWRYLTLSIAVGLVLCVGFSRIALGAHYLSDVLGAMGLGISWILLCSTLMNSVRSKLLLPALMPEQSSAMAPTPHEQTQAQDRLTSVGRI